MLIFCRWRRSSTLVRSAVEKRQLSLINSANCLGINISGCTHVHYSTDLTHQFLPTSCCRVLILHLKRYNYDPQLSLNNKLGQPVVIPRYLTLLSHCTEFTQSPVSISWTTQTSM